MNKLMIGLVTLGFAVTLLAQEDYRVPGYDKGANPENYVKKSATTPRENQTVTYGSASDIKMCDSGFDIKLQSLSKNEETRSGCKIVGLKCSGFEVALDGKEGICKYDDCVKMNQEGNSIVEINVRDCRVVYKAETPKTQNTVKPYGTKAKGV